MFLSTLFSCSWRLTIYSISIKLPAHRGKKSQSYFTCVAGAASRELATFLVSLGSRKKGAIRRWRRRMCRKPTDKCFTRWTRVKALWWEGLSGEGEKEGGRRQEAPPQASPDRVIDGEELTSRAPNVTLQLNTSCRSAAAPALPPSSPLLCLSVSSLLIQSNIIFCLYLLHRRPFRWLLPLSHHPHLAVICSLSFLCRTSNFSRLLFRRWQTEDALSVGPGRRSFLKMTC